MTTPARYPKIPNVYLHDKAPGGKRLIMDAYSTTAIKKLKFAEWIFREKIGGDNCVFWCDSDVWRAKTTPQTLYLGAEMTEALTAANLPCSTVIHAKAIGPGTENDGERYCDTRRIIMLDAVIDGRWLNGLERLELANNLGVCVPPAISTGNLPNGVRIITNGVRSEMAHSHPALGVIAVTKRGYCMPDGTPIMCKIKAGDFCD